MQQYTRLGDSGSSPPNHDQQGFQPPFRSEYEQKETHWGAFKGWWDRNILGRRPPVVPSGYLTLIPLSDERLKPRRTRLLVAALMLFALSAALATFFLVPRGVSTGEIDIQSDKMSWNTTKKTYQLKLLARVPIFNPNYLRARLDGDLRVYFYDTEAGITNITDVHVASRANPYILEIVVDASNVPSKYVFTILSECVAFPRRLIFFLKGHLTAHYLGQHQELSPLDLYTMLDCVNDGSVPSQALPG
eukprot:jgi/Astpho2/1521/Aster-05397